MLLKNYYKAVSSFMEGSGSSTANKLKNYGGDLIKPASYYETVTYMTPTLGTGTYYASLSRMSKSIADANLGIIIGTGDTPVTLDDHRLSGNMITAFAGSVVSSFTADENGATLTALCTITNSGSESITIREVGLLGKDKGTSSTSSTFLVERTVLDVPLTIEPGNVGQLTYTIKLNYPT